MPRFRKLIRNLKQEVPDLTRLDLLDDELIKAILAWPYVEIEIDEEKKVSNVWDCVTYDLQEWCDLAGLNNFARMKKVVQRVKKLKMILPDGEIAPDVKNFLKISIGKKLGFKPKDKKPEGNKIEGRNEEE